MSARGTMLAMLANPVPVIAAQAPDLFYARQQMAVSLGWHVVIACFGMVFPGLVFFVHWRWMRTGDPAYEALTRRWSKVMGVLFAVGAVSGTILSFEFGILWPRFMGSFGDVFGLPFALEGFAFFLEAIFIGIYLYGWGRLPPRVHLLTLLPVFASGMVSAFWIVSANGWMNGPAGFTLDASGDVVDVQPLAALFNSYLWHEILHMALAAFMVVGFVTAGVYAVAWSRGTRTRYHRLGFLVTFTVAAVAAPLQLVAGDWAGRYVADHQPIKLAAMEGVGETVSGAPFHIGGWYADGEVQGGIEIPDLLSLLAEHDPDATIEGLDAVPVADQPPVNVVRIAFQLMVFIGTGLVVLAAWFAVVWWRRRDVPASRLFWWAAVAAAPAVVVALLSGWIVTEVGRQPWILYDVMRTEDAVSGATGLRFGYFLVLAVYGALTVGTVYVLRRLAREPLPAGLRAGSLPNEGAVVEPPQSAVEAR